MNQSSSTGIAGKTKHRAPIREPRETLTINHVEDAILHLIENGKTPSEANVRGILGGSPNTLHPLVRRWFAERAPALLHGQITVVNSSDIPKAAHELIAELREDARRAADEALAREWSDVEAEREATQKTLKMAESKENELAKKAEENERIIPIFKANLELASAELAAARASAASAASDRRESEARRQAAEAIAKDAERRLEQAQAAIKTANDSLSTLSEDLTASRLVADAAKAAVAAKQAELDRVASEAAASMTALRESINEVKTAHLREVQSMRSTQSEAASRWAEAKNAFEKRIIALEGELENRISADAEKDILKHNLQAENNTLNREIEDLRRRNIEMEKMNAKVPEALANIAERLQFLEFQKTRKEE